MFRTRILGSFSRKPRYIQIEVNGSYILITQIRSDKANAYTAAHILYEIFVLCWYLNDKKSNEKGESVG
jgi:hypothetical protein